MQESDLLTEEKFLNLTDINWKSGSPVKEVITRFSELSFGYPLREILAREILRDGIVMWDGIYRNPDDHFYQQKHDAIFLGYQEVGRRILEASNQLKGKNVRYLRPNVSLKISDETIVRDRRWWVRDISRFELFRADQRLESESELLLRDPTGKDLLNHVYNKDFQYQPSSPATKGFVTGTTRYYYLYQLMLNNGAMSDNLRIGGRVR